MKTSDNLLPLRTIHRQLGRWATIVTRCLRGGRGVNRLSCDEYARLHNELMKQCYLYLQSDDLAKRHLFQQLFTLLMPWTSLASLRTAPPQVLASLLPQCQDLEQGLQRQRGRADRFPWSLFVTCVLLALVAGLLFYAMQSSERPGGGLATEWRITLLRVKLKVARMSLVEKSAIAAMIAVLVGLWMSWSTKRS